MLSILRYFEEITCTYSERLYAYEAELDMIRYDIMTILPTLHGRTEQ